MNPPTQGERITAIEEREKAMQQRLDQIGESSRWMLRTMVSLLVVLLAGLVTLYLQGRGTIP